MDSEVRNVRFLIIFVHISSENLAIQCCVANNVTDGQLVTSTNYQPFRDT